MICSRIRSFAIIMALMTISVDAFAIRTSDETCEMLSDPLAVSSATPRLGWKIPLERKGECQTAYQIIAASDPSLLDEEHADLWNTGKVESSQQQWIAYEGKALASGSQVWWRVRVWNKRGKASRWSEVRRFGIGLLAPEDWHCGYIGTAVEGDVPEPLVYKRFEYSGEGTAILHVNSLGYHEVYINGGKVGDYVLAPAVSEFSKRSLSVSYDVTAQLRQGSNDIVIWMARGWYDPSAFYGHVVDGGPYVRAQIDLVSAGGSVTVLGTDASWKARTSGYYNPEAMWGRNRFNGERVVAEEILPDFSAATLEAAQWQDVVVPEIPDKEVSPMMCQGNKVMETLEPVSIHRFDDDVWIVDFGRSVVGWLDMDMGKLEKGQEVKLIYADMINLDTDIDMPRDPWRYFDTYVASGEGEEHFGNRFSYHAFRYVKIENLGHKPSAEDLKASLIYTAYDDASSFVCSDEDMNAIHDMVHYTFKCLTLGGYMVDCPHLERGGYGGDGHASLLAAQDMYELYPLYSNWIQAYADAQQPDGGLPHSAPTSVRMGGGPYWCAFISEAPWQAYLHYGDLEMLRRYYPAMKKYIEYAETYMPDGLLSLEHPWPEEYYRHWFLGDWALPHRKLQQERETVDDIINCSLSEVYATVAKVAGLLGLPEEKADYEARRERINKLIHERLYDAEKGLYGLGMQADQAYPLLVGAVPEEMREQLHSRLVEETHGRFDDHLHTGLVGVPVITQWLTRHGDAALMYTMLKQHSYPGYMYMIDNGATTTWEHWDAQRSRIHNCYNGIGSWFYEALGGIIPDAEQPGYRHFFVRPQTVEGISEMKVEKQTPYGQIKVEWRRRGSRIRLYVTVPVGATATVDPVFCAPGQEPKTLGSGRHRIVFR